MNVVGYFFDTVHLFAQEIRFQEVKELKKKLLRIKQHLQQQSSYFLSFLAEKEEIAYGLTIIL